jgi:hypothetical protein
MGTRTRIEGIEVDGRTIPIDTETEYDGTVDVTVKLEKGDSVSCVNCSRSIEQYPHGWEHTDEPVDICNWGDEDEDDPNRATPPHDPDGPAGYVNWVGCTVREDRVHVNISVGDPRGSFEMVVWRGDGGTLLLSVPRKDEPAPHVELKHLGSGTYIVGPDLRELA